MLNLLSSDSKNPSYLISAFLIRESHSLRKVWSKMRELPTVLFSRFSLFLSPLHLPSVMNHHQKNLGMDNDMDCVIEGYEYVIVGSGPGGGPLAANLARRGHKVLLLEAGDDQGTNPNEQIPIFFAAASEDPSLRLDYFVKHYANENQAAKDPKMTWETPDGSIFVGLNLPPGSKQKGIYNPRAGALGAVRLTMPWWPFCHTTMTGPT
jgi:hypothetical protein